MIEGNLMHFVVAVIVAVIVASVASALYVDADGGDEFCQKALGPNASYIDGQPFYDSRLDCRAGNGTIVRGAEVPPMNLTSK